MLMRWVSPLFCFKPSCEKGFGEEVAGDEELETFMVSLDRSSGLGLAFRSTNGGDGGFDTGTSLSFADDPASGEGEAPAPSFANLLFRIYIQTCQSLNIDVTLSGSTFSASEIVSDILEVTCRFGLLRCKDWAVARAVFICQVGCCT